VEFVEHAFFLVEDYFVRNDIGERCFNLLICHIGVVLSDVIVIVHEIEWFCGLWVEISISNRRYGAISFFKGNDVFISVSSLSIDSSVSSQASLTRLCIDKCVDNDHSEAWFSPVDRWVVIFEPFEAKEYVALLYLKRQEWCSLRDLA